MIDAIKKLSVNPIVAYVEPDYFEELPVIPNDPLYKQLWEMKKIRAPLAWNYTTGSDHIAVGVIDTGIDYTHPEISKNIWVSLNGQ